MLVDILPGGGVSPLDSRMRGHIGRYLASPTRTGTSCPAAIPPRQAAQLHQARRFLLSDVAEHRDRDEAAATRTLWAIFGQRLSLSTDHPVLTPPAYQAHCLFFDGGYRGNPGADPSSTDVIWTASISYAQADTTNNALSTLIFFKASAKHAANHGKWLVTRK